MDETKNERAGMEAPMKRMPGIEKMQARYKVQYLQQPRRKWLDWSECSLSCTQTRHRRNCDDILTQNDTRPPLINDLKHLEANIGNQVSFNQEEIAKNKINIDKRASVDEKKGEIYEHLARTKSFGGEQLLEDDYADEGDEEDEDDSCKNVDPRLTFEERACTGGQCTLIGADQSAIQQQQATSINQNQAYPIRQKERFANVNKQHISNQPKGKIVSKLPQQNQYAALIPLNNCSN